MRGSIGVKLFLVLFCNVVSLVSLLGYASYDRSRRVIQEQFAEATAATIAQATDKLDFFLNTYSGLTRQLAVDPDLRQGLADLAAGNLPFHEQARIKQRIADRLNAVRDADAAISAVRLVPKNLDKAGVLTASGVSSIVWDEWNRAWMDRVVRADGEPVFMSSRKQGVFGMSPEPAFAVGRLLKNLKQRESEYLVVLEIRVKALSDMFDGMQLGTGGELAIVDRERQVVFSPDPEKLETKSEVALPEQSDPEASGAFVADVGGRERLVLYRRSDVSGWDMIGSVPVSELVRPSNGILRWTVGGAAFAALVAVLCGLGVVRWVGRPIAGLCRLMEEGENGDLTVRAPVRGRDEIARLGRSFNRMMAQLAALVERIGVSATQVLETASALKEVSRQTVGSADEIALAARDVAGGAARLAEEAERSAEVTGNVSDLMRRAAETNAALEQAAGRVRELGVRGAAGMGEWVEKTDAADAMFRTLADKITQLRERAGSIRRLLAIMEDLTKRTNILSLNASIEAARAGAAGKSFAVVAGEIRGLALQAKESIGVAERIVADIQQEVDETVERLSAVSPMLAEQAQAVRESAHLFEAVSSEMEAFLRRLAESTAAILELERCGRILAERIDGVSAVSQSSAASSEQVAALADGQREASRKLEELSHRLESMSERLRESFARFRTG